MREFGHITLARILLAQGDDRSVGKVDALLERLLDAAEQGGRTGSAIEILVLQALARRLPSLAHRKKDGGVGDLPIVEVAVGDALVVFPHETCPVDGVVLEGRSTMNESYLAGEPYFLPKATGSAVLSGAINGDGALTIRAEKTAVDSRYAKIMQVMRESEQRRRIAISGCAGGRDALPAGDCHSGGDHRLRSYGGTTWHPHQGSSRTGKDRHLPHRHL